ncbi:hypothetical protein Bbelb_145270 [Branchiostoma belcheri]|nr:hypothetical protein Bbelb_145270 [Branchiostoma belcheri]
MREEVEIGLGDGRAGYHSQEGAGTTRLMEARCPKLPPRGHPPPSRSLQLLSPIQPHIITHFLHLITSTCARHVPTGALLGQPGFNTSRGMARAGGGGELSTWGMWGRGAVFLYTYQTSGKLPNCTEACWGKAWFNLVPVCWMCKANMALQSWAPGKHDFDLVFLGHFNVVDLY